jgi:hypothetical protein
MDPLLTSIIMWNATNQSRHSLLDNPASTVNEPELDLEQSIERRKSESLAGLFVLGATMALVIVALIVAWCMS